MNEWAFNGRFVYPNMTSVLDQPQLNNYAQMCNQDVLAWFEPTITMNPSVNWLTTGSSTPCKNCTDSPVQLK